MNGLTSITVENSEPLQEQWKASGLLKLLWTRLSGVDVSISEVKYLIVQVDVPEFVAEQMFRIPNLDNVGSGRWASEGDILDLINSTNSGIIELATIPIR